MIHQVTSDISLAGRACVVASLKRTLPFIRKGGWFDPQHPYLETVQQKRLLKEASDPPFSTTLSGPDLSGYLGSAAISHSVDAWSYIGRALAALLSLSPNISHHLAYYAELRAALSILAAEGIGIFDDRHFIVDVSGAVYELRFAEIRRTHQVVWKALQEWAGSSSSVSILSRVLRLDGYGFDEWLQACGTGTTPARQCYRWFDDWGLDLKALPQEQTRRNVASYSPSRGLQKPASPLSEISSFTYAIWTALTPDTSTGFGELDRHLLRLALESTLSIGHQNRQPAKTTRRDQRISNALSRLDPALDVRWHDFLSRKDTPQTLELLSIGMTSRSNAEPMAHQMIARAIVLARFATGIARRLLQDAGATIADLNYWQVAFGEELGFWSSGATPADFSDLWLDVNNDLASDVLMPLASSSGPESPYDWRRRCAAHTDVAAQCERVPIWGLG